MRNKTKSAREVPHPTSKVNLLKTQETLFDRKHAGGRHLLSTSPSSFHFRRVRKIAKSDYWL